MSLVRSRVSAVFCLLFYLYLQTHIFPMMPFYSNTTILILSFCNFTVTRSPDNCRKPMNFQRPDWSRWLVLNYIRLKPRHHKHSYPFNHALSQFLFVQLSQLHWSNRTLIRLSTFLSYEYWIYDLWGNWSPDLSVTVSCQLPRWSPIYP